MEKQDHLLSSGLYEAAHGLMVALAASQDWPDKEGLSRAEGEVRQALRRHKWPSPEEDRVWVKE